MNALVVDASVAASWLFDDEDDPRAGRALARLEDFGGIVPQLWHYEIRNVLLVAQQRQRITAQGLDDRLAALTELPLQIDTTPDLAVALALARNHGLSYYDGLYLELACRLRSTLASLDAALVRAAVAEGLSIQD